MKRNFASFCNKKVCEGCKRCVKGEKLVLFMGGTCYRNCWYCSLSESRSKSQTTYANERPISKIDDLINEAIESNATGAGITGGDPLVYFEKVIKYATALKKKFGKSFHIHIYLPLHLVNDSKLKKLKKCIDEVRFHPSILINNRQKAIDLEIEKIISAAKIFGKENTGIEIPIIPSHKEESYKLIKSIDGKIGFVNLNELELSETNIIAATSRFALNEDTYTIRGSVSAGKEIISKSRKDKLKIKIHLCTAKTKDTYQYINRLKNHNILPFGNKTSDGTVVYFAVYPKDMAKELKIIKKLTKNFFVDKKNKRIIINMNNVLKVYENSNLKIARIKERPTFDQERLEYSIIGT